MKFKNMHVFDLQEEASIGFLDDPERIAQEFILANNRDWVIINVDTSKILHSGFTPFNKQRVLADMDLFPHKPRYFAVLKDSVDVI